jgi:hypothetical protein
MSPRRTASCESLTESIVRRGSQARSSSLPSVRFRVGIAAVAHPSRDEEIFMNQKTTLGIVISVSLIAGLASASGGSAPQGDPPKPGPSASAAPKEKPKAPKAEQPKKPSEGGW